MSEPSHIPLSLKERLVPPFFLTLISTLLFPTAIVADMDTDLTYPAPWLATSPEWMNGIRKGLAPLFFDGSLQSTFFMILSARVVVYSESAFLLLSIVNALVDET